MWADATKGYFQTYNDAMVGSTAGNLLFMANNAEKARITSAGNLLVGTTTDNGTDRLQVSGSTKFGGQTVTGYANPISYLNDTSGTGFADVRFQSNGVTRWSLQKSTANNFNISRFDSAGTFIDNPLSFAVATGVGTFTQTPVHPTAALYDNSTNSATTAFVLANAIPQRAPLGGSVDLNTITSTGTYHQPTNANASSGSNYPAASAGMLEVYAASSMVYQRYTIYNSGQVYTRAIYNGTTYPWRQAIDSVGGGAIAGASSFGSTLGVTGLLTASGGISVTGTSTFSARPTFNGATPWDSSNLNFATPPAIGATTPSTGKFTTLTTTGGINSASTVTVGPGAGQATSFITPSAIFATKTGNTTTNDTYTEMWNDGTTGGVWMVMGSSGRSKGLITATAAQMDSGIPKILNRNAAVVSAHWSGNSSTPNSPQAAYNCSATWLSTGRLRIWLSEPFAFATHSIIVTGSSISNGTNWLVCTMIGNAGDGTYIDIGFTITGGGGGVMGEGQMQCTVLKVN
jgi:hypothetical protein